MTSHSRRMHITAAAVLLTIIIMLFMACENGGVNPEEVTKPSQTPGEVITEPETPDGDVTETETPDDVVARTYTVKEVQIQRDGLRIYGKLYLPDGADGKLPAVILSHSANLNADSMNSYAAGFAERGCIAYAFDFCGACDKSRSEGSTDDMTLFTEIEDLKAVLSFISSIDEVDSESIFLFGTSQGGLVSTLTAEECQDMVKGEILLYPAFNIPEIVEKFSSFGSIFGSMGGYSQAFMDTLNGYDTYAHIGAFGKKVLIIHGSADFIVNSSYSEKAAAKYRNCMLRIIQGAGHGFNSENYSMSGNYDALVWKYIDEYLQSL